MCNVEVRTSELLSYRSQDKYTVSQDKYKYCRSQDKYNVEVRTSDCRSEEK